jgi:hypothetical protein
VQIITYRDLATRRVLSSPASLILDELDRVPQEHMEALRRLDGVLDAYRIGCCSTFPDDPAEGVRMMSALRPAEFRSDVPLLSRYPMRPEVRAREHVAAYVSRRAQDGSSHGFRRSSVELLEPTTEQVKAVDTALDVSVRPMSDALAEGLQVVSAGTGSSTGPKIARAVELARDAVREEASVVLVTRHSRTAQMIRIALRPLQVDVVEHYDRSLKPEPGKVVVVVRPDGRLPDLRGFERVVLLDYMWSSLAVEAAVGSAGDESGPLSVVQLHLRLPLDDRCALLAARRRELGPVVDPYGSPTTEDHAFLLSDRR